MQNYKQPGQTVTFTAPSGGVTSGLGYKIGQMFVVATNDVAETEEFEGLAVGVAELVKASGAWTEGALLYWDDTAKNVTTTASGNLLIGCAAAAAASGATVGEVRLNGIASDDIP